MKERLFRVQDGNGVWVLGCRFKVWSFRIRIAINVLVALLTLKALEGFYRGFVRFGGCRG